VITNYLTIDVEEYFQVAAFEKQIKPSEWHHFESRVNNTTENILSILEYHKVKATFFIVGWVAEKHPELVREISRKGHEIGCHSYKHQRIQTLTKEAFKEDTKRSKEILENISGKEVIGYRAPTYSITGNTLWSLEILVELGFKYDSSIFPIYHDRYGIPDAPRFPYKHRGLDLKEYPLSTVLFWGRKVPIAGGGYFRLFPYWFTRMALKHINNKEKQKFVFYIHPWEIDPDQPRMNNISLLSRFRHYNNLQKAKKRFQNLLMDFQFSSIAGGRSQET
jgi:polysaccharide deacetylase family protein (PEP-CTERM system associated)